MLNSQNVRELAYLNLVTKVEPIEGYDRVELVYINGWTIVAGKGEFHENDIAIYIEPDALVPAEKPFSDMEFLVKKHYKIKIQKMCKRISEGLLLSLDQLGWTLDNDEVVDDKGGRHNLKDDSRFVTQLLNITYYVKEDNKRKSNGTDKYKAMAQRNGKLFSKPFFRFLMRRTWGKKLLFVFFGRKKDSATAFPTKFEYVHKTDEERIENMPWVLADTNAAWIKTTKIDGTSSTYILERKPFGKFEYYVCSRNVRQLSDKQGCYFGNDNVYWSSNNKYHIREFLEALLKENPTWKYVCLQGETAGVSEDGTAIQGNPHGFKELRFFGFNLINSENGKMDTVEAAAVAKRFGIEWVPIVDADYHVVNDMEAMKLDADGPCDATGATGLREGFVYRQKGVYNPMSFKNVSRQYMMSKKGD